MIINHILVITWGKYQKYRAQSRCDFRVEEQNSYENDVVDIMSNWKSDLKELIKELKVVQSAGLYAYDSGLYVLTNTPYNLILDMVAEKVVQSMISMLEVVYIQDSCSNLSSFRAGQGRVGLRFNP